MSELKAHNINDLSLHDIANCDFYLKSEADKYIGELKKERDWLAKDRAQSYDDLEKRAQLNIKQEEFIRHHKYKRCLAMVEILEHIIPMTYRKLKWQDNWRKRWLELSEKFKEGV